MRSSTLGRVRTAAAAVGLLLASLYLTRPSGRAPRRALLWARGLRRVASLAGGLLYLMAALLLLAAIAWFTTPRILGWEPQVVLSGSMEPSLPTGSVAFVVERAPEDIREGDILTFRQPGKSHRLVSHRVVEVLEGSNGPFFKTKGDANDAPDPWLVPPDAVVGTVRFTIPYMGYVTQHARTPAGFALLVAAPAALIITGEIRAILREMRRRKEAPDQRELEGL